jgi:hypothetical protein
MILIDQLKFICNRVSFLILKSENIHNNNLIIFIPSFFYYYINLFFKYSYFFKFFSVLDLGIYEIPSKNKDKNIQWCIYKDSNDCLLFLFSIVLNAQIKSIEFIFRNAKWLEKEASEFFNIFFLNKKDRRTLFLIPLLYESPLRKKFPLVGFYEIFVCFYTKKIKFKHLSLKN